MEFSEWLAEWGWTIFAAPVFIIVIVLWGIVIFVSKNQKAQEKREKEERERLTRLLTSETPIENYSPTKIIKGLFSVDYQSKRWRPEFFENCRAYGFGEISGFEYIENDKVVSSSTTSTQGGITRALAGGLLAGDAGAIIGASTARTRTNTVSTKEVTSRKIRISLTNMQVTQIVIDIPLYGKKQSSLLGELTIDYETEITEQNGETYKIGSEAAAQEIISMIEGIIAISSKDNTSSANADNTIEEIRRYKQLLDDGIISEEEFIKKKQQLMNI